MAKPRRSRRTLATLLVLVLISVTVISLDESGRTHSLTSGIKSVATDIFSPLRSGVNGILRPVGDFFAGAVHYGSLQQENHKLQFQIGALRQQAAEGPFEQQQLKQLQTLLKSHDLTSVKTLPKVIAQTTAVGTSNFAATITIDKGRAQGVVLGDPVVGGGGLVGQVVQVSHGTAIVRLVTDGQSRVGVAFGTPQQYATVEGQGLGNPMTTEFIAPGATVRSGEMMFTSGLEGADFPPGIPVARVTSVRTVAGAAQKDVRVQPTADLQTLAYVEVVQWSPAP